MSNEQKDETQKPKPEEKKHVCHFVDAGNGVHQCSCGASYGEYDGSLEIRPDPVEK